VRPDAVYRNQDTGDSYPGAELLHSGLLLDLPPGDHASVLVHLRREG
jgi:alpha-galactosidase